MPLTSLSLGFWTGLNSVLPPGATLANRASRDGRAAAGSTSIVSSTSMDIDLEPDTPGIGRGVRGLRL